MIQALYDAFLGLLGEVPPLAEQWLMLLATVASVVVLLLPFYLVYRFLGRL